MPDNQLYVILHGHFYQPPREDPWIDEIDRQPSAYPDHNWNERINKQCYAANAASRVIDNMGRIDEIINNYRYVSFNFGPTLLEWLRKYDGYTYDKIIEADRLSMQDNNGHGNAIAQGYNHIIMPLASNADKITQIEWGLKYFERHFGRKSESIWLAETAINDEVAEFLIHYGIRYVILSPTQAESVCPFNSDQWRSVANNSIDPSKPYILKEKNGEIAVFFYYGGIAHKLSFEHLLRKVEYIRGEFLAHNNPDKPLHMINVATDGETYGHHEPFGDMCLSRLINENRKNEDFIFTNYGRFLELNPPQDFVRLKEGNDGLGTAWSCAHGVDRWRRDCGCSNGGGEGWNQSWREPFRNALDFLRDRLYDAAERELSKLLKNVWNARNEYIHVVMSDTGEDHAQAIGRFFAEHSARELTPSDRTFVLRLMESLHNGMLMYTSCGWFFAEISGIETVQDMRYAARAIELAEDVLPSDTKKQFLHILARAKSNISEFQNGKWIYENWVDKFAFDHKRIVNQYLIGRIMVNDPFQIGESHPYYFYTLKLRDYKMAVKDGWQIYKFVLDFNDSLVREESEYIAYVFRNDNNFRTFIKKCIDNSLVEYLDKIIEKDNARTMIKDFGDWFTDSFSLTDLKYDTKEIILNRIFEKSLATLHKKVISVDLKIEDYLDVLNLFRELQVLMSEKDQVAVKELLNNYILNELHKLEETGIENYDFTSLIRIIQTVKRANLDIDYQDMVPIIRSSVSRRMHAAIIELNTTELRRLERLIDFTNIAGMDFEKYDIQNLLYDYLEIHVRAWENGDPNLNRETMALLFGMASKFNLATHRLESRVKHKGGSINY